GLSGRTITTKPSRRSAPHSRHSRARSSGSSRAGPAMSSRSQVRGRDMAKQKKNYAQLLSEREQRKKKALEEAIALFRANVGDMSGDGTWDAAENFAWEIFEEIARGEMGGFKDLMLGWGACDKFSIAMLCKLAETYLYNNDKSMPQRMPLSLRAF